MIPRHERPPSRFHLLDYVALHARRRPGHPAVMRNGEAISYAALHRDLSAVIQALTRLALPRGGTVAIGHADLYIQLLLIFGFETLGIVTGSFRPTEGSECHELLRNADLVMAPPEMSVPPCRRVIRLTGSWIADALACAPAAVTLPRPAADDPVIILRSSGTTGQPKRMVVSQRILAHRRAVHRHGMGMGTRARLLAVMHFSVGSTQRSAANCLRLGATFMFHTNCSTAEALVQYRPTHMIMLPFQLGTLLTQLPDAASPMLPGLTIQTTGAKLPEAMRRAALGKLCGRIVTNYGANETGPLGMVDADGIVTLIGGTEAEVLGPGGARLPLGEAGLLRVRGPGMIAAYMDDAAATAEIFKGGWFNSGDIAVALGHDKLRLVGRRSDVLNLGGIKVAAADVESRILAAASPRDVAILQREGGDRAPPLIVCVAAKAEFDIPEFAKLITPIVGYQFTVRIVPEIPRTAEGKIRRNALRQSLFGGPAMTTRAAPEHALNQLAIPQRVLAVHAGGELGVVGGD
jgi:acyl-coenzyme A synthetase/AMP-(fatty) acid ligase